MTAQINKKIPETAQIPVSDYVIFGGTGDLALRKILPALLWRFYDGQVSSDFRLFIVSRKPPSKDEFAETLRPYCESALAEFNEAEMVWQGFLSILTIQAVDLKGGAGMADLAGLILERATADRPLIFYMAISPELFGGSMAGTEITRPSKAEVPTARWIAQPQADKVGTVSDPPPMPTTAEIRPIRPPMPLRAG